MEQHIRIKKFPLEEYRKIAEKACKSQSFKGFLATDTVDDLLFILLKADRKIPEGRSRLEYLTYVAKTYVYKHLYPIKANLPILKEPKNIDKEYFEINDLLGVLPPIQKMIVQDKVFHSKRLRKIAKENKLSYYLVRVNYTEAISKLRNYYANIL